MAAAGGAPNEFAGADLEPGVGTFLVDQRAFENVGLLDQHMLMVGQLGAGLHAKQCRDDAALAIEQQCLDLAARKPCLLPRHVGGTNDPRVLVETGLVLRALRLCVQRGGSSGVAV